MDRDRRYFGPQMFYQGYSERQVHPESLVECVVEAVRDRGLAESAIAIDMAFMAASHYKELRQLLPRATFVDAEPLLWRFRVIKSPEGRSAASGKRPRRRGRGGRCGLCGLSRGD